MLFGVCLVFDVVQKMVDDNFFDILGVLVVYDDIIVVGVDGEGYDIVFKLVLDCVKECNIKFNWMKI